MNVYTSSNLLDFPSSEYGGLFVWVARDLEHLRELISAELENVESYQEALSIEEIMDSVILINSNSAGLQVRFDT